MEPKPDNTNEVNPLEPRGQDPMPPEPQEPPEPRFNLGYTDLVALLAMSFEQGYRTGKANLKLANPREDLTAMAYAYSVATIRERPWEQTAVEEAVQDHVRRVIQLAR